MNRLSKKLVGIVTLASVIVTALPATSVFAYDKSQTVHAIGNAHIDAAWNWRYEETIREVNTTFKRALDLMDSNPGYKFTQSSSKFYQWADEYYPELAQRIKGRVDSGDWEIVGGQVIEPDLNVPSGESLVRQSLYGQLYFRDNYGQTAEIGWVPDVFGFNYNMPQILQKSGMNYFLTTKLNWNDTNKFPYEAFNWKAPDGSEVLTYKPTHDYSINGSSLNQSNVSRTMDYPNAKGYSDSILLYGSGDHGGGPNNTDLTNLKNINSKSDAPNVVFDTTMNAFEKIEDKADTLPTVDDELYLEKHRGTLTSAAYMKKYNRDSEIKAEETEKFNSIATILGSESYPQRKINKAWDKTNLNQFHDVLPGSSITPVYNDAFNDAEIALNQLNGTLKNSMNGIGNRINTEGEGKALVLYNPLSWDREDMVESEVILSSEDKEVTILDENGKEVPSQIVNKNGAKVTVSYKAKVPAMGYTVYRAVEKATTNNNTTITVDNTNKIIENQFFKLTLDPKTGNISSLYDKVNGKEVFEPGKQGNELHVLEDTPREWDAWDVDGDDMKRDPVVINNLVSIELVESGANKATYRVTKTWSDSTFIQDITLYSDVNRVDVGMDVEWNEHQKLLKVAFPMNIPNPDKATYEIAYSSIERGTNKDTSEFEVSGHKWADISKDGYGVSILNDSKYGWNTFGNVMRLTLLKAANDRGGVEDRGHQEIKYSIYPHANDWKAANTVRKGYEFNYPIITQEIDSHEGDLANSLSFGKVDKDNVVLTVLKKAEKSDDYIVRVYESEGQASTEVKINLPSEIASAVETNLIEDEIQGAQAPGISGNTLSTTLGKYEIKTFKVKFNNTSIFKDEKPVSKPLDLTDDFNLDGITSDANRKDGNFNGKGETFSAELMPETVTSEDILFNIGSKVDGDKNFVQALGQSINVPKGEKHGFLYLLGAAAGGRTDGEFKVNYKDGSFTTKDLTFTDWQATIGNDQKTFIRDNIAINLTHTHIPTGNTYDIDNNLFVYKIALDENQEIESITLPDSSGMKIAAMSFVDGDVLANLDTEAPSKVENLSITGPKEYYSPYLDLTWNASTDNIGVANYLVYRATKDDLSDLSFIGATESTSYKDENVSNLAKYTYLIKAVDYEGNASEASEKVSHYACGNIALGAKVTADGFMNANESPLKAIDGDLGTKWCINTGKLEPHWITLDLEKERTIDGLKLFHAGAGGESMDWNTSDYTILAGNDLSNLTEVAKVTNNTQNTTEHQFATPIKARYIKINITKPTGSSDVAVRLYEIKVYGNDEDFVGSVPEQAPTITAVKQENTSVVVNFEKVSSADSYILEYGTEAGNYTERVENLKNNNVVLNGLTVGETYYFRVIPVNIIGEGTPSVEASYKVNKVAITTVDLTNSFNMDGIASINNWKDGNFDNVGWAYYAEGIPEVITNENLEFKMGSKKDGDKNVIKAVGQALQLPLVNANKIYFLSASTKSSVQYADVVVTYEDGTTENKRFAVSDWCKSASTSDGEISVLLNEQRISNASGLVGPANNIYMNSISIDNSKKLKSITLPNNDGIKIFAMTLTGVEEETPESNNAYLSGLKVGDQDLTGFNKEVYEYNVTLPWNETTPPQVSVTTEDAKAVVAITQADKVPGVTTINVRAEDGTEINYKVNFANEVSLNKVELSADALNIETDKTTNLKIGATLTDGTKADADKLKVDYTIGDSQVIRIKDGVVTALKAGSSTIKATVNLNGKVVESNTITIKVTESAMEPVVTSLEANKKVVNVGDEVEFKVTADKAKDLAGFDFSLAYNKELFELTKVSVNNKFGFSDHNVVENGVKVLGTIVGNAPAINEKTDLVVFTFKVKKTAKDMEFVLNKEANYTDLAGKIFTSREDVKTIINTMRSPDTNNDGKVMIDDLTRVARRFGQIVNAENEKYDLNYDGVIDIEDIAMVSKIILGK
ncbi:glycoside hydrolase family 38 C-terminal domain-containing protein [Clostridium intestinale]|uniref:Glycosyl hydrolase family protein n=1 Tax=Clostridium intestinale URNW TaxID=1294142 RepID=U2N480_9CLOT|nr:glycoside hydrolase family 38 C-terminal domain-containing protein [Clostridium intestinale]ERK30312.1 glycosyl hydrolase family protein [Clostridium intestinale URNW]